MICLDTHQLRAVEAFEKGRSVAILGGAGSGKSFLLNEILRGARARVGPFPKVSACALTNQAANNMGGITLHKLFGAPACWDFSKEHFLKILSKRPDVVRTLQKIEVLIIDELSVLSKNDFDSIDHVLRTIPLNDSDRNASVPAGGHQLVVAGDPFQLEPITSWNKDIEYGTAYESRTWYLLFGGFGDGVVAVLDHNHRQSGDIQFYDILSRVRLGRMTSRDVAILNATSARSRSPPEPHTRLCLRNNQVNEVNDHFLRRIPGTATVIECQDTYLSAVSADLIKRLDAAAPRYVRCKVGSRVIITRRVGDVLPGMRAIVLRILKSVETSVDGSSGTTFHTSMRVELGLEIERIPFERGNFRTRTARTLGEPATVSLEDDECDSPQTCRTLLLDMQQYSIRDFTGEIIAYRRQVPVISAYAITVHRSQGLTLSSVAIDFATLGNWRPKGMVYVALSRCPTLKGLWVRGLNFQHVSISGRAYNLLDSIQRLYEWKRCRVINGRGLECMLENEIENDLQRTAEHTRQPKRTRFH